MNQIVNFFLSLFLSVPTHVEIHTCIYILFLLSVHTPSPSLSVFLHRLSPVLLISIRVVYVSVYRCVCRDIHVNEAIRDECK
ncbi:hypothetical protein CSUI_007694 [Cystoisospora suis]|uniref:Transmembrane protein n=1 Tax=Cystoisospora suis TaxID=483139 RepID=A0A2C6KPS0_9APIC|nr:hypothetical protein CSUI_007694 [Cystoisospora suis]